jgi:drug/metabolite transporter (DMT)-like permease
MAELIVHAEQAPVARRPLLGYGMAAAAATLFGINGSVAKTAINSGLAADRLTEVRCAGAFVGLLALALLTQRDDLKVERRELPFLMAFGIGGVALVQWTYFVAIGRLPVGIALVIQYVAPVLVALYAFVVLREHVRERVWVALGLSLSGLVLVLRPWQGMVFNTVGLLAAAGAMVTFAFYLLMAERGLASRGTVALLAWGFAFATLFWTLVLPWWSYPVREITDRTSLFGRLDSVHVPVAVLAAWVIVLGTIVPFILIVGSLNHIPATRAAIVAMLEPVVATFVAWVWLGETLAAVQLVGAAIVITGVLLAQSAR